MLELSDVEVRFGGLKALDGLSLEVGVGEIVSLIGPNGAGKSTAFNVITRIVHPQAGRVRFDDIDLLELPPHAIAGLGIGRTYQGLELFGSMTVGETLIVGYEAVERCGLLSGAIRSTRCTALTESAHRAAREVARRLDLDGLWEQPVTALPYGVQKRVDIGRALVGRPRLLLLDEPAAGLTHSDLDELGDAISRIRSDLDVSVLLVEHHMPLVMSISDRVYVLDAGRLIADGSPEEVRSNQRVIEAYLGVPVGEEHA
ncbi:ABC transporter ATP-binding protein [Rhodococcus triatomae]|nr:ABC transporter [Rhodococcus triatomae BKS 15-14]